MKKVEKYIYIVLIVILVGVIVGGTTYMLMKDKEKTDEFYYDNPKEDNKQNNKEEDNNKTNNDREKEEKITLSKSELAKYLDYVPGGDYNYYPVYYDGTRSKGGYTYDDTSNINNIDKYMLISNVLSKYNMIDNSNNKPISTNTKLMCSDKTSTNDYYSLEEINAKIKIMYNYELTGLKNTTTKEESVAITGGTGYYYASGYFISSDCGGGGGDNRDIIHLIDNYKANEEELAIYEYAANYTGYDNNFIIFDYINNTELSSDGTSNVQKTFKENKDKFTKYKHTFKKNNTGYYWYSTEVVK